MITIAASDLAELLPPNDLVEAIRAMFKRGAEVPLRHHHEVVTNKGNAAMLLMPAWNQADGAGAYSGVKIVNVYPQNAVIQIPTIQASYLLFDKQTGVPKAVLDGRMLTLLRTAAASVLAATYLARQESKKLLMVGTGQLAPHIVKTYVEVVRIEEVGVWGRNAIKAQQTVDHLNALGISAETMTELQEGVEWADVISCATMSADPLVLGDWLRPGQHLDLIGGYTRGMRETDDRAVNRSEVFVDTREGALAEAGDIIQPIENGVLHEKGIRADLSDLAQGRHPGRTSSEQITLFKSVGTALEDLAAAQLAFERTQTET